jgi:non-canonical poly(A) RNA polymerase PAPD5/7
MKTIKDIIDDFTFIKPIIILLKFFLRQRDLNETFTGGISSFLLFNMVYAYLQYLLRDKNQSEEKMNNMNLGSFLLGFLKFYGFEFNYKELGISIRDGGRFFKKYERNYPYNDNLCFENFQEISIDIGRAAYQFPIVRELFQDVLCKLYKNKSSSECFLKNMIIVTSELRKMKKLEKDDDLVEEHSSLEILNGKGMKENRGTDNK